MAKETKTNEIPIEEVLQNSFVQNLLGLLSSIRMAVNDAEGELSHDDLISRIKAGNEAYNQK